MSPDSPLGGAPAHPVRRRLARFASQLPHLPWALSLVWRAAPDKTAVWMVLLVVGGALPAATLYALRELVDAVVALGHGAGASGWAGLRTVVPYVGVLGALLLATELLNGLTAYLRTAQGELVQDHMSRLIQRQSLAVDLAFYDRAEFFDHLHRARSEAGHRPLRLLESIGAVVQGATTLVAMLAVLASFGVWLPAILLASSLPAFWIVLAFALKEHDWSLRTTADERRAWYYDWLLTARETAAEVRAYSLGARFRGTYDALRARLRGERLALVRRQMMIGSVAGVAALLLVAVAGALVLRRFAQGLLTVGDLTLIAGAFQQGQRLSKTMLERIGQILGDSLFIGNLREFLTLAPTIASAASLDPPPEVESLGEATRGRRPPPAVRCRDVSFRYPGSDRLVLDRLSLEIGSGQVAALVGGNGAGKTTLLKLMCRFYDPEQGSIEIDGIDLRELDPADLRSRIAMLFQTPIGYNTTAAENIGMGRTPSPQRAVIESAARRAGADTVVARLAQGYETPLGVWFTSGVDLSVGEWQRLALARAYVREAPLLILDEPTSAMDPWGEAEWLDRLEQEKSASTVVVVTHRVSTAARADVIHVLDAGRVIESGNHARLLDGGGRYAELWSARPGRLALQ